MHTVMVIGVGLIVAATRQNAGRLRKPSAALPGPGGVKVPASTVCATVIVAFGSVSIDNVPHEALALAWRVRSGTSVASRSAHKLAVRILMTAPFEHQQIAFRSHAPARLRRRASVQPVEPGRTPCQRAVWRACDWTTDYIAASIALGKRFSKSRTATHSGVTAMRAI